MQARKKRNYNKRDARTDGSYGLFNNNCHAFTGYCVTEKRVNVTMLRQLKPIVEEAVEINGWIEWRYDA